MKDHYNRKGRLSSIKGRFKEECPHCFEILERFEHTLKLNDYSIGRIEKYWSSLKTIHKELGKCFDGVQREDIEKFVISVNRNERWSEWTKSGFKSIIKFFMRWLLTNQITGDYPDMVKWVPTKMKKNNSRPPEKLLTKEEVIQLAEAAKNPRDRALVLVLYETGCRIGELLNMKIKNIEFDDYGCYIMISGKTGWRRVRLINYSKDLVRWLDIHPFKENGESYVWISQLNTTPNSTISPSLINGKLKELAKKCNITKPVNVAVKLE